MVRYTVEGVVLKSQNYKEADKIFTLLTRGKGKVRAIAKGVRKISSRRAGNLDTLNHVRATLSETSFGYKVITEVATINSFSPLKRSLKAASNSYYILELMDKFLGYEQKNDKVLSLLLSTLSKLKKEKGNYQPLVNVFEISLMKHLGYGMSLNKCVFCDKKYAEDWENAKFNYAFGGLVCGSCEKGGVILPNSVASLLFSLGRGDSSAVSSKSDYVTANELIKNYIKVILEGDLKTTAVFGE